MLALPFMGLFGSQINPQSSKAWLRLSNALAGLGQWSKACAALEKSVRLLPKQAEGNEGHEARHGRCGARGGCGSKLTSVPSRKLSDMKMKDTHLPIGDGRSFEGNIIHTS